MIDNEIIKKKAKEVSGYVIDCRRTLHKFPEISGQEVKTKAFIRGEVDKLGLPVEDVAHTAQIVTLDTGRPGPHVLLRADIDALPITENPSNLAGKRCVISENPGRMHACGHDGHTSMLLGAMKILYSLKDQLKGIIYFVYEEGEENGGSIQEIIKALEKYQIDTCWGIHLLPDIDVGKISVEAGPRMAGVAVVNVTVHGRGGHGSRPDLSINPTFAAASMFVNAAVAFENQLDVNETVTLGLTSIESGNVDNTFSDTALIHGTLRFFSPDEGQKGFDILQSVCSHTAAMNKCTVEFKETLIHERPTINDPAKAEFARKVLGEVFPEDTFVHFPKMYGTESFNNYQYKYPGIFAFVGVRNEKLGAGAAIHTALYDMDEAGLEIGVIATLKYALASLGC